MTRSLFDDSDALRRLYEAPEPAAAEAASNFPLGFYEDFLREIRRLDVQVITFDDLFRDSDDWDYRRNYPREFASWRAKRDPKKRYLLLQHDVDSRPFFTQRMMAMEAVYGVRSNVFIFRDRYSKDGGEVEYEIDHDYFQQAERAGFVIGYHQNAFALAGFDVEAAVERYRSDVAHLSKQYRIRYVVPHGGAGREVNGVMLHNVDVPMPPELEGRVRWVFNRYGATFASRYSDGGLGKTRDPARIESFDIIRAFLHRIEPGTRARCLVHPQRWGFNVDMDGNPLLARAGWYREVCMRYGGCSNAGCVSE